MRISISAALLVALSLAAPASAQQNHAHQVGAPHNHPADAAQAAAEEKTGPHGGRLEAVGGVSIETVLRPDGLRLFAYGPDLKPLDVRDGRGLATVRFAGEAKSRRYDLYPDSTPDGGAKSLAAAADLSAWAGRQASVDLQIMGVAASTPRPVQVRTSAVVPMTEIQRAAAAIAVQETCPVSGQPLGSMGEPIPVTIGAQTVYVCCQSCVEAVKQNPTKHLPGKPALSVTLATEADAAAIAAQEVCLVADAPLGSMGTPLKVTGLGRDVFICCKACLKALEEAPRKHLAKLPPLPEPEVEKAAREDAPFIALQKRCPVMDKPLGAMGEPCRTVVEGRVVYLCCPSCAKKLQAAPQTYLEKLARQGVEPPVAR